MRYHRPLVRGVVTAAVHLVACLFRAVLGQMSGIGGVGKNPAHHGVAPRSRRSPLALGGGGYSCFRQGPGSPPYRGQGQIGGKHRLSCPGGGRIGEKVPLVVRVLSVAQRGGGPDEQPLLPPGVQGGAHLAGDIGGVKVVGRRQEGEGDGALPGGGVKALGGGNVAHPVGGEIALVIIHRSRLVPAQPGQVLGEHQVNASLLDVAQQSLKAGAAEVGAGIAVVGVDFCHRPAPPGGVVQQIGPLVLNAHGLSRPLVLPGQAEVEPYPRPAHGGSSPRGPASRRASSSSSDGPSAGKRQMISCCSSIDALLSPPNLRLGVENMP